MKTRFTLVALLLAMVFALSSCSSTTTTNSSIGNSQTATIVSVPTDQGKTNEVQYANYNFWSNPISIKLLSDFTLNTIYEDDINTNSNYLQTFPGEAIQKIKILQDGMIAFFKSNYNVDITKRIQSQRFRVFKYNEKNIDITTLGFVDTENRRFINFNEKLFTDEFYYLFSQTYVHEAIHQLGISNNSDGYLMEGITDALTDMVLTSMGLEFSGTNAYFESRTLAYQLLAVDKKIPILYFTDDNFSLIERISERLNGYSKPIVWCDDVGIKLRDLLSIIYSWHAGVIDSKTDLFPYVFDAQEIVRCYCQSFNPSNDVISYIRSHYLIEDYETFVPEIYYINTNQKH